MSIPTIAGNVFRRDDLAAHVQAVYNNAGFILNRVAPVMNVDKQTGKLMVIKAGAGMEYLNSKRADGAGYRRIAIDLEAIDFSVAEYGIEMPISAIKAAAYGNQINMDQAGAKFTSLTALRDLEKDSIDAIYTATSGAAASAVWTGAGATPGLDVTGQSAYIMDAHGIPLSELTIEIPHNIASRLPFVTDVRDRLKIQGDPMPGSLTEQQLAGYFGCKEVVIASAGYNTAKEGQTASISPIAPNDKVLIYKRSDGDVTQDPGFAKTCIWLADMVPGEHAEMGDLANVAGIPVVIEQYTEKANRSTIYRSRLQAGLFIMRATMARKLTGCA